MADDNMANIINNFKNMLHNNQPSDDKKSQENGSNNLNITPEMIGNLANMLKNNIEISTISSVLGHSSVDVTNNYLSIDIEQLRKLSLEVPHYE